MSWTCLGVSQAVTACVRGPWLTRSSDAVAVGKDSTDTIMSNTLQVTCWPESYPLAALWLTPTSKTAADNTYHWPNMTAALLQHQHQGSGRLQM